MLRAACLGLIGWCIACGPSVAVSDGDTTTSGTTTTTTTQPSTTDDSATVVDVTTASPESSSSTTDTTTSGTTTTVDDSSSSGEFTCGCPDDTQIGLDDELPDGETAAELLAHFTDLNLPMEWFAYGDALTTVHFVVEYRGGELTLGPGGEDGCLFLSSPCNDGVQMEVVVTATTDDGWLTLEVPAMLRGYGTDADVQADNIPIADNAGTLAIRSTTCACSSNAPTCESRAFAG